MIGAWIAIIIGVLTALALSFGWLGKDENHKR